jgi:hypothetical protein
MNERYRQQMSLIQKPWVPVPRCWLPLQEIVQNTPQSPAGVRENMKCDNDKQNVWQGTLLLMFASGFAVIAVLVLVILGVLLAGTLSGGAAGGSVAAIP